MCGRYTVLTEEEVIRVRAILQSISLHLVREDLPPAREAFEVFPGSFAPILTQNPDGLAFENALWGFRKWSGSGVIINARSETILEKAIFAKHVQTGRCVVPAGEFFEWDRLPTGKKKHYAKDKDGNLLFLAGLYRDRAGEKPAREFVILTKKATGALAEIHHRMPVILRVDQLAAWLSGAMSPAEASLLAYDVEIGPCEDVTETEEQLRLFDSFF